MLARCYNTNLPGYKDYGARGIVLCDEWRSNYIAFREWAFSNGYRDDLTIERKDVNGNYEPGNCEWIPGEMQPNNRRDTIRFAAFGEFKPLALWSRDSRCCVPDYTLKRRVLAGWDGEQALTTPQKEMSSLEAKDIPLIRQMLVGKRSIRSIADEFGVGMSTIVDIKKGRAWVGF